MNTTQLTPNEITALLESDGWELKTHLLRPGNQDTQPDWSITIIRKGESFSTEYHSAMVDRQWTRNKRKLTQKEFNDRSIDGVRDIKCLTEPITPTLADIMFCLIMDANCVRDGQSFEDFAADFGYDEDSRKAEKIFDAVTDTWRGLVKLDTDFDEISALFQDY